MVTAAASAAICVGDLNLGHSATPSASATASALAKGWAKSSDGAWPQTLNGELRAAW
jgi:hypothetical protein